MKERAKIKTPLLEVDFTGEDAMSNVTVLFVALTIGLYILARIDD